MEKKKSKKMNDLQAMLKSARNQAHRAAYAEVSEGNLSKAVTLYALAGSAYLETLHSIRTRCGECMTRIRELKSYAVSTSASRGSDGTATKPEDSDSGSDDDDEDHDSWAGMKQ